MSKEKNAQEIKKKINANESFLASLPVKWMPECSDTAIFPVHE